MSPLLFSRHLATSVVASFIKRLSQLSLFSPPLLTPAILLIISNCLKRHSQCRILINYRPKRSHVVNNTQADHDGDADDNGNVDENSKNTMDVSACIFFLSTEQLLMFSYQNHNVDIDKSGFSSMR
ncbi:unnamed protein product [Trichobilharzia regenti]|nr:unnamed protein product [Trichobilharzia regenti]